MTSEAALPSALAMALDGLDCITFRREMSANGVISYPEVGVGYARLLGTGPGPVGLAVNGDLDILHWADRECHRTAIRQSAERMERLGLTFRAIARDGQTHWLKESAVPRRLDDGRVAWDGLWADVTAFMRAEHRFQNVVDHANDAIFILDGRNRIEWVNAAATALFGFSAEDLIGQCLTVLLADPCPVPVCDEADSERCFARGHLEAAARRRDGTTFAFEMNISESRLDGQLSLIIVGRDITRHKTIEAILDQAEHRLKSATANLPGVVFQRMMGPDGLVHHPYVSDGIEAILGCPAKDFVDNPSLFMDAMPPEDRDRLMEALRRSAKSLEPVHEHCRVQGPDHRVRWLRGQSHPRRFGAMVVWDGILLDVTDEVEERTQIETALREGQKLEALGHLAGGVAHELNNMLGPILMAAEMIERSAPLGDRDKERCRRIIGAAKHGRDIVRNVLAYCRKEQRVLAPVDLVPLLAQVCDLAGPTLPPSIRVERVVTADHALVMGDAGQIHQVLLNLINNARDAMAGGGVLTLTLRNVGEDVLLSVADTGCGMAPAVQDRVFDPFFTTKPVGQGTGLGLSVVQGILKSMDGCVSIDSTLGKGTILHLRMPRIALPRDENTTISVTP